MATQDERKRLTRLAIVHVIVGILAMLTQIGVSLYLFTTAYWYLAFVLIICNVTIRKTDEFMDSLKAAGVVT